jgi:predicted ATPase
VGGEPALPPLLMIGPLVGRQGEVAMLEQWFQRAASGHPQLGFVSGEVGIGKTTVVDLFLERLAPGGGARIARGQCVEHYGRGEPYLPLLGALGRLSRGPDGAPLIAALRRYAPMWLAQFPGLVTDTELERLQRQVQGATPARILRELDHALVMRAADTPLVLVLEDLHWSDISTVDVLAYLGQHLEPARLMVLGTYRPVDTMLRAHPLRRTVQELCGRGQATELVLEFLPAEDVLAYVAGRCGGPVAPALAAFVHQRTDGNALFMVNVIEHLVQQGQIVQREGLRRNAHHEAIVALRTGLALLATLPDNPERTQQELILQRTLGDLLMATKGMGAPEVGQAYSRAHVPCQQLGATRHRFGVLSALTMFHATQGRLGLAQTFGQQLLDRALCQPDPVLVYEGHTAVGVVDLYRGDLIAAKTHFEQSLELSATQPASTPIFAGGLYPGIARLVWLVRALWVLGYVDQAQQRSQDALALARQTEHAPSIAYAEYSLAMLSQCRQETAATHARACALMTFAAAQGLIHRVEQGRILLGWAVAMEGDAAAGIQHIQQGLAVHQEMGIKMGQPYYLSLLAEAFGQAAQPEAGLTVLAEALTLLATTEERWWEAELSRLMGALQLQLPIPDVPQAEACFQKALDVARRQQAKALELRATMSLSRLWQRQGKREAAWQLLAEVYGWFTEAFDTHDLQEAKALLEELSSQ